MSQNVKKYSYSDKVYSFIDMTTKFCRVALLHGYNVRAFDGHVPQYFLNLPEDFQSRLLDNFAISMDVMSEMMNAKEDIDLEQRFLWRMIQQLDLKPTSEFFSLLKDDDVIEIYEVAQFVQIFRNLKFFKVCSYTLDDILCRPYWELFHRKKEVTDTINVKVQDILMNNRRQTVVCGIEPYLLIETNSERRLQSMVENKYLSPLFDRNNKIAAIVNVMSGKVLNQEKGWAEYQLVENLGGMDGTEERL